MGIVLRDPPIRGHRIHLRNHRHVHLAAHLLIPVHRGIHRYGSLWCGASLTAIIYFAVFKGLKSILAGHAFIQWIDSHLLLAIFICWVICSMTLFFIQRLKINILRITILWRNLRLALAFAGNDLVNFIGVPVAGFDAYSIARHSGDAGMLMRGSQRKRARKFPHPARGRSHDDPHALDPPRRPCTSLKPRSRSRPQGDEGQEQYGSSLFSRTIVRAALNINAGIERVIPPKAREAISRRFEFEDVEHERGPLRHDPSHGKPNYVSPSDRHGHLAETPPFDHLRMLHGRHGFLAR